MTQKYEGVAQGQWFNITYLDLRFLILRGLVGASRKVANELKDREWLQMPRWVKEKLKYHVQKLKRDNLTIADWADECRKENRERQRPKE